MMASLLYRITAWLRVREIRIHGNRYIERYYLGRVFGITFYLHRYLNSDGDRYLHDHPWTWSCGVPLVGGYTERRLRWLCPVDGPVDRLRTVRRFLPNFMTARTFHKIEYIRPGTWTLFFHGGRTKSWGFLFTQAAHETLDDYSQALRKLTDYRQPFNTKVVQNWTREAERGRTLRARGVR